MPYFEEQKLKRVNLVSDKDYWVDIVDGETTYKQQKDFNKVFAEKDVTDTDAMLLTVIKAWNLDNEAGVVEVNQENLDLLKREDVFHIIDEYNASPEEDKDAKKNSQKGSSPTSPEAS